MIDQDRYDEIKHFRYEIGIDILKIMQENEDLPLPNVYRLAKTMQEYFIQEGMVDEIKKENPQWRWRPTEDYWRMTLPKITDYMRYAYKLYFGFKRDDGKLTGQWKFMEPAEWESTLKRSHVGIGTRIKNQNRKVEDSVLDYSVNIPHITEVPLLN